MKRMRIWAALVPALALAACGGTGTSDEYPGVEEASAELTALQGTCTFTNSTKTVAIASTATQTIVVSRRAFDGAVLVNGNPCVDTGVTPNVTATVSITKVMTIDGTAGTNETLVLDLINGALPVGAAAGPAITVDLGAGGTDAFKVRGSDAADKVSFSVGAGSEHFVNFAFDNFPDAEVTGAESYVVSLGKGADEFTGAGVYPTSTAWDAIVTVYGGEGNDKLTGGSAADVIHGGIGADELRGGAGDDDLFGDAGNDTFFESVNKDGNDAFDGGDGTADTLDDGTGTGLDTVNYSARTVALSLSIDATGNDGDQSGTAETDDILATVENVVGGSGDDTIVGSTGVNVLSGGAGNDTITGDDGNDVLNGDAGDDTFLEGVPTGATSGDDVINGGAGTDTASYAGRTANVTASITGTAVSGQNGETDNIKTDVENLTGGDGDDQLTGSSGNNVLTGGPGGDTLTGGAGDDVFAEGNADSGGDIFIGGTGVDRVDYSLRVAALLVTMDGAAADDGLLDVDGGTAGNQSEGDDVRADVENLDGGTVADDITGNDLANVIFGGAGDDSIDGGAGDDTIDGGAGTNTVDCGAGDADIAFVQTGGTLTSCEL